METLAAPAQESATISSKDFKAQGFLLLKNFFPREEVETIRGEAKEIFAAQMIRHGILSSTKVSEREFEEGMLRLFETDLETFTYCGKHVQHLISLHRLSLSPRIMDALKELGLEAPCICTRPVVFFNAKSLAKKEVYWRLSWHQDWRTMQGSLDSVIVWIPLVDIDQRLGAIEVIPGSHKWGLLPADIIEGYGQLRRKVDAASRITVEVAAGDALFFSALLVHRSGTNITDSIRWSCHFRFNNLKEETFIQRGYPQPYTYKPQEELITPDFPTVEQVNSVFISSDDEN